MNNYEKFKTAKEREIAFGEWCKRQLHDCPRGIKCLSCMFEWIELEAEEENPLPCPFCGRDVRVHTDAPEEWVSCYCGYSSKLMNHGCSVAEHNRVARAVAAKESERKEDEHD